MPGTDFKSVPIVSVNFYSDPKYLEDHEEYLMRIIVGVLLFVLSLNALAADKSGNYAIWGKGQKSCYRYTKDRSAGTDEPYKNFIMGYLTAYNAMTPETYSISRDMKLDEIMTWLDDYCELKQMHGIESSLLEFITSQYEKRYRDPPGRIGR